MLYQNRIFIKCLKRQHKFLFKNTQFLQMKRILDTIDDNSLSDSLCLNLTPVLVSPNTTRAALFFIIWLANS